MNIRNLVLFVTTVAIYVMVFGWVINLGLQVASPISIQMILVYTLVTFCTALMWPMFEDMFKSIFKKD